MRKVHKMDIDAHTDAEIKTVALNFIRETNAQIGEHFAEEAFPNQLERENAEITLSSVGPDFFYQLISDRAPRTTYPSIIYNASLFPHENKSKSARKEELIRQRIAKFNINSRIIGHYRAIHSIIVDENGKYLLTASADSNAKVWHAHSLSLIQTLKGHEMAIVSMVASPDKKIVATISEDKSIFISNLINGAGVSMIFLPDVGNLTSLSFNTFGSELAVGTSNGNLKIFKICEDPDSVKYIDSQILPSIDLLQNEDLFPHGDQFHEFSDYNPDDFIANPPALMKDIISSDGINDIDYSPGGSFYALALDNGEIHVHAIDEKHVWSIAAHNNAATKVRFLKNFPFSFISHSTKGAEVKMWNLKDLSTPKNNYLADTPRRAHYVGFELSCDESYITAYTSGGVFFWRTADSGFLWSFEDANSVVDVSSHPSIPPIFAVCTRANVLILDIEHRSVIRTCEINFETPRMLSVKWAPSGIQLYAGDTGGGVYVFRSEPQPECHQLQYFFPDDHLRSEWVHGRGQVDSKTGELTHQQSRASLKDNQKAAHLDQYDPYPLSSIHGRPFVPDLALHARAAELAWLTTVREATISAVPKAPKPPRSNSRATLTARAERMASAPSSQEPPPRSSGASTQERGRKRGRGRPRLRPTPGPERDSDFTITETESD